MGELDGTACADALAASRTAIVEAERDQVLLVAQWCDLHPGEGARPALPGTERSVAVGGDGTPLLREFASAELGLLLGLSTTAARSFMRDVLDLRHRHPRMWSAVAAGTARFFQARQVARAAHAAGLDREQALHLDARVAPYLDTLPWGRLMALVEATVIEADPEAAEQRRLAAEMERFVRTGRSTELGTKTIYARARAGDAIFFVAMCDRIAQILAQRDPTAASGVDADRRMDVLRSEAIGILAHPARALALLRQAEGDLDGPDPDSLRLPATLYVHIDAGDLARQHERAGAVRIEGVGPVTSEQAIDWLRHCHVTVRPVLDLTGNPSADGYEATGRIRETAILRHPFEVFPHGTLSSRAGDLDHTQPYQRPDAGGPPAQTCPDNLGPLSRLHHRLKTHGGWQCHQPRPGVFLWRSPHGHWAQVDGRGTTYLGRASPPASLSSAPVSPACAPASSPRSAR